MTRRRSASWRWPESPSPSPTISYTTSWDLTRGKVLWYRDYWLAPYRTMYVQPQRLLQDIPK